MFSLNLKFSLSFYLMNSIVYPRDKEDMQLKAGDYFYYLEI